jgi:hypothetical protein
MILKIVLGLVLLLGVGNVYQYVVGRWSRSSYEAKITALQNAETEAKIERDKYMAEVVAAKKKQLIKRRVSNEQENVDVEVGDPAAVVSFFRLRRKGDVPVAPDGGKGSSRPPTR